MFYFVQNTADSENPGYVTVEKPCVPTTKGFKTLEEWLNALGLSKYLDTFTDNGWENLMVLHELTAPDLDQMRITNWRDREKILKAVWDLGD